MVFDKKVILDNIKTSEERLLLSKALDQAGICLRYFEPRFTVFLDPYQQKILQRGLNRLQQLGVDTWGGYDASERNIMSFFPDYMSSTDIEYPISVLEIMGHDIHKLSHRDFLGSILGLGIKREKIGDILINDSTCIIFCMSDIKDFIQLNLTKVSNQNVCVEERDLESVIIPEKKFKMIHTSVTSLRLDAVLSAGVGESRNKVLDYIKADKVNVNWEPSKSISQPVGEGDVISVRGKGRMILERIGGNTRKGRISISIKKFI